MILALGGFFNLPCVSVSVLECIVGGVLVISWPDGEGVAILSTNAGGYISVHQSIHF